MRKAKVFYQNEAAGILEESADGYKFSYDPEFITKNISISASLPVAKKEFVSKTMFPFFEGMLPEGWYLDIVAAKNKIDKHDEFGVMLASFGDTVGAVSLEEIK